MEDFFVCDLLFKQYEKPKNCISCKAVNIYDNKYRINVYTKEYDNIFDLEKTKIKQSFFARLDKDQLEIIRAEGSEIVPKIVA